MAESTSGVAGCRTARVLQILKKPGVKMNSAASRHLLKLYA